MLILTDRPRISRRHALRGIGVSVALPFFEAMLPGRGFAATAAAAPRRSVFVYLANGVNTLDYQITTAGRDYHFSQSLRPLEKHRDVITPISGLFHAQGIGSQHECGKNWLTGARLGPTDRNTVSIDQLIAEKTAPHTRCPSLELSDQGGSLAWNAEGVQLPALTTPRLAFRELFEAPADGIESQRRRLRRDMSILDVVLGEAKTLERSLGAADRGRLEQYLTSVRELEVRTERAETWLQTPRPTVDAPVEQRLDRDVPLRELGEYLRTMYDLIVLALETDMTRVITFNTEAEGHGLAVPEIGVIQPRHAMSHHNNDPVVMESLTKSDEFHIAQLAYFLDRLRAARDAQGPLLDTTMVLYGSGMSNGTMHSNANLPTVLAGGSALGLRHGAHIDFNAAVPSFKGYDLSVPSRLYGVCHTPVNNTAHLGKLLLTMARKMGVEIDTFGGAMGELAEVLG